MHRALAGLLAMSVAFLVLASPSVAEAKDEERPMRPPTKSAYVEGIDVSYHQGSIDWWQVATAGKRFAFVRATAGTLTADTAYWANRSGARAAGLAVGSYHFANPDLAFNDAGNEAAWFLRNAAIADRRPCPGTRPRDRQRPRPGIAVVVGADVAVAGHGGDRCPADHLHEPEVLVHVDGKHGLVRAERLFRAVDRALDEVDSARGSGGWLGRQRLDVLAVLECGHGPRDRRRRRSRSIQRFLAAGVAVRALTYSAAGATFGLTWNTLSGSHSRFSAARRSSLASPYSRRDSSGLASLLPFG